MLISEREATAIIEAYADLTRTPARRLLRTGIAGAPERDASGRLGYDRAAVEAVARRTVVDERSLEETFRFGLLVARLSPSQEWDVDAPVEEQRRHLGGPWDIPLLRHVGLTTYTRSSGGFYPLVATVSGYVVAGADIVEPCTDGRGRLVLAEPGAWFDELRERRWFRGRGGAPLDWWQPAGRVTAASRVG